MEKLHRQGFLSSKIAQIIKSQDMCLGFYSYKFDILLPATKYARANKFANQFAMVIAN
jgi:hypothetical protein